MEVLERELAFNVGADPVPVALTWNSLVRDAHRLGRHVRGSSGGRLVRLVSRSTGLSLARSKVDSEVREEEYEALILTGASLTQAHTK